MKKRTSKLSLFLKISFSILILTFLLWKFGIKEIIKTLSSINPYLIIPIIALLFINLLFGSWKMFVLFEALNTKPKFLSLFKYYTISWFFSLFTPGKFGQFSLVYLLKKENIKIGDSSAIFIIDKIIALITLFILSVFNIFLFFKINEVIKISLILFLLIFSFGFIFLSKFGKKVIKKFVLKKYAGIFTGFSKTQSLILKKKSIIVKSVISNLVCWGVSTMPLYILLISLNQKIGLFSVISTKAMLNIISFIPISLSGLGIREASAVFFFSKLGLEPTAVLAVYLFLAIITYTLAALIILLFLNKDSFINKEH